MNEYDRFGNIVRHVGLNIAWRKVYDEQGREIEYHRDDGQSAYTTWDGNKPTVRWDPPIPTPAEDLVEETPGLWARLQSFLGNGVG